MQSLEIRYKRQYATGREGDISEYRAQKRTTLRRNFNFMNHNINGEIRQVLTKKINL